jgi:hypothetical protein
LPESADSAWVNDWQHLETGSAVTSRSRTQGGLREGFRQARLITAIPFDFRNLDFKIDRLAFRNKIPLAARQLGGQRQFEPLHDRLNSSQITVQPTQSRSPPRGAKPSQIPIANARRPSC